MDLSLTILTVFLLSATGLNFQQTPQLGTKSTIANLQQLDKAFFNAALLENKLDKKTVKALQQRAKQEVKMKNKVQKIDSIASNKIFVDADKKYKISVEYGGSPVDLINTILRNVIDEDGSEPFVTYLNLKFLNC